MIKLSKQANRPAIYCILGVFVLVFILGSLNLWGVNCNKEIISVIKTILLCSLPFFGYWAAVKLPNPKGIDDISLLPSTEDIKVRFYSTKGFINRNNQISFVRFFFGKGFCYMYFRNYLKIYEGPFYIKNNETAESNMFYIKSISDYTNGELTLEINPKNILNPHYKLGLRNLSKKDYGLIKQVSLNFNK